MGFAKKYLEKQPIREIMVSRAPENSELLKYIVIIPAFSEPDIFNTLNSLLKTTPVSGYIEVYILVNYPEDCPLEKKEANRNQFFELTDWANTNSTNSIGFYPMLVEDLPRKHAGAGLARKILMDWACQRFEEKSKPDGIIFSLDADTLVPGNYFNSIDKHSGSKKKGSCYIFNFAHPTTGAEYSEETYNAIMQYELHMRYYKQMLESIGYPYYHYTIGSCFAIQADVYIKAGGMNKRKGGEDFYFLHKVFPNTKTTFLANTILKPSPRPSWRVPFGTGPAIRKILENKKELETYHPKSFAYLEHFLNNIENLYEYSDEEVLNLLDILPIPISNYLKSADFLSRLTEIKSNSASHHAFIKRFYNWFDAFQVLKFLNYSRNYLTQMNVRDAVSEMLTEDEKSVNELLEILRKKDLLSTL